MPKPLINRPCLKCGDPTDRLKYCEPCAKIRRLEALRKYNLSVREEKDLSTRKEEIAYRRHFSSHFTWDNPNDLLC